MFGWLLGKKKKTVVLTKIQKQKVLEIYDYEIKFSNSNKSIIERISKFLHLDVKIVEEFLVYRRKIKLDD